MQFDPLSDAFARIFNAEQAGHYEVTVKPASKMLGSMLSIMQASDYIGEYEKWESRYLPARDLGLLILTTNQGVMNHYDAKKERVGGRLLAYIF